MNSFKKVSIIAIIALSTAGATFAGATPHESNRQITRGSGAASAQSVELSSVRGAKATPHTIIRHTRVASQRQALRNDVNTSLAAKASEGVKRMKTASQRTRNS